MSNNIFNTNDDDIFEDYSEDKSSNTESISEDKTAFDKVFADSDSPFKNLIQNSSLKVNFSEAFYQAAHHWIMQGYNQANSKSIIQQLVDLTNGKFLYQHRLLCCKEVLARKKTVIKFLTMLLEEDVEHVVAKAASEDYSIHFTQTYFNMFFRSFYNIHLHTYYHEVALYKALCEITGEQVDLQLCDHTVEPEETLDPADYINFLYIQYFDKDLLQEKIDKYVKEIFDTKDQA
jgi:hypothetical protein